MLYFVATVLGLHCLQMPYLWNAYYIDGLLVTGAQIIDLMLLVVDVVKGMQTQTAECLVIGEITCQKMIVVLNKVDLLPSDKKTQMIDRVSQNLIVSQCFRLHI